jgi:hypothetical protein
VANNDRTAVAARNRSAPFSRIVFTWIVFFSGRKRREKKKITVKKRNGNRQPDLVVVHTYVLPGRKTFTAPLRESGFDPWPRERERTVFFFFFTKNGGPADGLRDVPETYRNTPRTGLFDGTTGAGRHPGAAEKRAAIRGRFFRRTRAATGPK